MGDLEGVGVSDSEKQYGVFLHKHKSEGNSGAWPGLRELREMRDSGVRAGQE